MQSVIRRAGNQDLENVREFLSRANLGTDGLNEETVNYFILLEDGKGKIKGTLGLETFADCGLLRSLVVSGGDAEKEILILFNQMLQLAKEQGLKGLYLATNKSAALPFFEVLGFEKVERGGLPSEFNGSEHIQHILSVDNSFFLKFSL